MFEYPKQIWFVQEKKKGYPMQIMNISFSKVQKIYIYISFVTVAFSTCDFAVLVACLTNFI